VNPIVTSKENRMKNVRIGMAAATVAAVLGMSYLASEGSAGDSKEVNAAIDKIVAALKKGDMPGAKSAANEAKKFDLEEVMDVFKIKKKGGRAWPGAKETDGIEAKYREVARDGDKNAAKNAAMYEEIALTTAAVGLIAEAKAPEKDSGKKLRKNWVQWSQDMQEGAHALAKAAQSKAAAEVKSAATKVNNSCNACHSDFRN